MKLYKMTCDECGKQLSERAQQAVERIYEHWGGMRKIPKLCTEHYWMGIERAKAKVTNIQP